MDNTLARITLTTEPYLVDVVLLDDVIEDDPQIIEEVDHLQWSGRARHLGERDDVGEVDGGHLVKYRLYGLTQLQRLGDRSACRSANT